MNPVYGTCHWFVKEVEDVSAFVGLERGCGNPAIAPGSGRASPGSVNSAWRSLPISRCKLSSGAQSLKEKALTGKALEGLLGYNAAKKTDPKTDKNIPK